MAAQPSKSPARLIPRATVLVVALSLAGSLAPAAQAVTQAPLTPVADSYVDSSHSTTNYGTSTQIRVDGSPTLRGYLRFTVPALPSTTTRATLRLFTRTTGKALSVRGVSNNTWAERTLTYKIAPAPASTATASLASFSSGAYVSLNVTPLVTPLGAAGGNVSFALTSTSSTAMALASRESG